MKGPRFSGEGVAAIHITLSREVRMLNRSNRIFPGCVLLASLSMASTALADTGQLAHAYPAANITIDGDLSEWADELPWHPIARKYDGGSMPDPADFSARYRVAYDVAERTVLVAIEVRDSSHFVDPDKAWTEQDTVILYVDPTHSTRGSGSWLYTVSGTQRDMQGTEATWDPVAASNSWARAEAAVVHENGRTTYEYRVQLDDAFAVGASYGIDLLLVDRDEEDADDDSSLFLWGPAGGKSRGAGRLADVILMPADRQAGTLEGQIGWAESEGLPADAEFPQRVRITSVDQPERWVHVDADDDGRYRVHLPAGAYEIDYPYDSFDNVWNLKVIAEVQTVTVHVRPERVTEAARLDVESFPEPDLIGENGILFDFDDDTASRIDAFVDAYMDHLKIPGVSIAVVKDGQIVYHRASGVKNWLTGDPVDDGTLFEAASITKIVFAFAVNRLAERGVIDLDKPLHEYLPFDDIAHDARYERITARHCLSHQTGFPNWARQNDDGIIDIKFHPGTKFGYSGEGFEYLGRVVSHITGKSLEEVLFEEVQVPMNCTDNMYFADRPELRAVASHGHFGSRPTAMNIPAAVGTAHSMHTEARVFADFLISLMEGRGLSDEGYAQMFDPQVEVPGDPAYRKVTWPMVYGLGFSQSMTPHGMSFGHGGSNDDFMCFCEAFPDANVAFVVFTNAHNGAKFNWRLRQFLVAGKSNSTDAVSPED